MDFEIDETKEVLDRLRRIETRVTKYLIERGFDTQSVQPKWDHNGDNGVVHIPSTKVALQDVLEAIPDGHTDDVAIYIDNELYCWLGVTD